MSPGRPIELGFQVVVDLEQAGAESPQGEASPVEILRELAE
jgi:hypothetical protein